MKQEEFYQKLSDVPEVPDLFPNINARIKKKSRTKAYLWSLAATIILTVGIIGYSNYKPNVLKSNTISSSQDELPQEVIDELQIVSDFFDDKNIDEEISMYASVNIDDL